MTQDDPPNGGVVITPRDIYDQLLELKYDVKSMVGKIDRNVEMSDDHEGRIRDLEKWKYAISAALVSGICALIIQLVQILKTP